MKWILGREIERKLFNLLSWSQWGVSLGARGFYLFCRIKTGFVCKKCLFYFVDRFSFWLKLKYSN